MKIDNGNIKIRRGENCALRVGIKTGGVPYEMKRADTLRFSVKRTMIANEPSLIERTSIGDNVIRLASGDTVALSPGKYRYEITLAQSDGSVHIVVDPHNFEIIGGSV